ncbi:MAG: hypothetical protein WBA61_13430 [Aequorivita sp.]
MAGLRGGTSYDFKYVFTYTDHLGNIRLKYAQDPSNNNQISILEEDHYYPYGLKHSGYNSFHQIFATEEGDGPGTGIVLTPVNPFLGESSDVVLPSNVMSLFTSSSINAIWSMVMP